MNRFVVQDVIYYIFTEHFVFCLKKVVPEEKSTSQKLATDAMFKLEHGEKDVSKSKTAAPIIDRLHDHRERWRDDYASNRLLRDQFRVN
jgi:coiled-coil domain-containing protein 130